MINVIKLKESIEPPFATYKRVDTGDLLIGGVVMPSTKDILDWDQSVKITGDFLKDSHNYYKDPINYIYYDAKTGVRYKNNEINRVMS